MSAFPRFRAVGDQAVLAEFGEVIGKEAYSDVIRLDSMLAANPFKGFIEAVLAYVSLLVAFDPLRTDHQTVEASLRTLLKGSAAAPAEGRTHDVAVCYDADLSPDLPQVAAATGLDPEAVIALHLSGDYRVFMYGFAPGYAYLAGTPDALRLPRKPSAVRNVAAGSVLIAGAQCLVSTLKMPTGWWIIGRSPTRILRDDPARPFLFDVADKVQFRRISRADFDVLSGEA